MTKHQELVDYIFKNAKRLSHADIQDPNAKRQFIERLKRTIAKYRKPVPAQ